MLKLSDEFTEGIKEDGGLMIRYVSIGVVKSTNETELTIATVSALHGEGIRISINWEDDSYKNDEIVVSLIEKAKREAITALFF
jgi:hypothetical protein